MTNASPTPVGEMLSDSRFSGVGNRGKPARRGVPPEPRRGGQATRQDRPAARTRRSRHEAEKLLMGFEPMTSSLPRKCSTTELQQRVSKGWFPSGKATRPAEPSVRRKFRPGIGRRLSCAAASWSRVASGRIEDSKKAAADGRRGRLRGRAGEGNRTLVTCLEGRSSTIELHPRTAPVFALSGLWPVSSLVSPVIGRGRIRTFEG